MKNIFIKFFRLLTRIIVGLYCIVVYRIRIIGRENVPKEGNLIFCGNHRSYLDPVAIILTAPRELRFMAKEELRKNPIFKPLCSLFNVIYVKRDSKDITPLKEALKTLKNGGCIGIFPEGTRNGLEKNNGEMKEGAAYMALKTGAQIVPIGIVGEAKPFHKNQIIFGKPIDITEYKTKDKEQEKKNKEKVTEIIKEEILKLTNSVK